MSRVSLGISLLVAALVTAGPATCAADLVAARAALYADYSAGLDQLTRWCAEQRLGAEQRTIRSWLPQRAPDKLTLFVLPAGAVAARESVDDAAEWRKRWQALRDAQADALVALARRAASEHQPSLACELLTEAVRENPDHQQARRVLGYVRFREAWHTPFEIRQLGADKIDHPRFGWLPKSHVARYDEGQRYYQGRWMPAADEAALRGNIKRGWRVESEHYRVTTNHSLEEGVSLARELETLYAIWQQVFIGYAAGEAELLRRFDGRASRREAKRHEVVYFRTRDEYIAALRSDQPQIDISLGIYFARARRAYFFAGEGQEPGTLYHEASHQLFQESRPATVDVTRAANFWAVEGIACYMETLENHDGAYYTLGGMNAGRLPAARERLLVEGFYLPLAQLVEIDMQSLQANPRIKELYGQNAALADFFMHADGGRYREPYVGYLAAIYAGRATTRTLADLTGADYPSLDREYREFMSPAHTAGELPAGAAR